MIFVDTGAWFASVIPADVNHAAASLWLRQNKESLLTTDYIVDETLTLLRARGYIVAALSLGEAFFAGSLATLHFLSAPEILQTWHVFHQFRDKSWSFTDCSSKVVIEQLGIIQTFAFDQHFRQFGAVIVVP